MANNFPGQYRLKKSWEFKEINKMGCKFHTPHFVLYIRKNSNAFSRLGLTVSKKVGNAVIRNRLKRLLREFYRVNRSQLSHYDYLIIAKKNSKDIPSSIIHNELNFLKSFRLE